jgi:uncharacterized protein
MTGKKAFVNRPERKTGSKRLVIMAVLLVVLLLVYSFLSFWGMNSESGQSNLKTEPQFKKHGELVFLETTDGTEIKKIDIEVADNDQTRAQGLMYRSAMEDHQGMLFIFTQEDEQGFWMRNTRLSLDIMYVAASGEIKKIYRRTIPYSEETLPSVFPAQYVVEVVGGWADKYGVTEGHFIKFTLDKK